MAKRKMAAMDDWLSSAGDAGRSLVKVPASVAKWEPSKAGEFLLDVVPYPVKTNPLYKEKGSLGAVRKYYMHWGVGPNREAVFCNAGNFQKPCPVCEYTAKLWADPDQSEENQKVAKSLKKKERELWNVYLHAEKTKGVQVLNISSFAFGSNLADKINLAPDDAERKVRKAFADPDRGRTLLATGTMEDSGGGKQYIKFTGFEFRKRKEPLADDLLDKAVCLDDLVKMEDYKKVKEMLHGGAVEEEEPANDEDSDLEEPSDTDGEEIAVGDEVEFTYKKKVRRGTVKKIKDGVDGEIAYVTVDYQEKPAVVALSDLTLVEADDEGEEDDDDDFVTQTSPSKNGKKKPVAVDDDEPDEDSDLEDEEDDDPPASRPKRRAKR